MIDLSHHFGLTVAGESIEDEATLAALRARGCDIGQGYLFAKAVPSEQLQAWLQAQEPTG